MKSENKTIREKELHDALLSIALLGSGIRGSVIDWHNIGKMAVSRAQEALAGKCEKCGRPNPFKEKPSK